MDEPNLSVGSPDCPSNSVALIIHNNPSIRRNWLKLARGLGTPESRIKIFEKDFQLGKITYYDLVSDLIEIWVGRNGSRASIHGLFQVLEEEFGGDAADVEESLRLQFNLACKGAYHPNPPISWTDLSLPFQKKVIDNFGKFCPASILLAEEIVSTLTGSVLASLMTGRDLQLFRKTIPSKLSYYVSRTLISRTVISSRIFNRSPQNMIFLFTGIERSKLISLAGNQVVRSSCEQLKGGGGVTAKFIILEEACHFEKICGKTEDTIHWLHWENGQFNWVRSRGNMRSLKEFIDEEDSKEEGEADFCENLNVDQNQPICISDTPGMGKSVLLAQLGRQLSLKFPERVVIFLVLGEFVQKLSKIGGGAGASMMIPAFEEALLNAACENDLGKVILKSKLRSKSTGGVEIELLLDGLDEVGPKDASLAEDMLKIIKGSFKSIRLWVTSRPQLLQQLEGNLSTLAYHIKPFDQADQLKFLKSFWSQENHPRLDEERLGEFGGNCLDMLKSRMNSSGDEDIAGIPLQCLLIGEVFEEEAIAYANYTNPKTSASSVPSVLINSITDLYKFTIAKKLQKCLTVHLTNKENMGGSQPVIEMHMRLSLELIFPGLVEESGSEMDNLLSPVDMDDMKAILNVGILEASKEAPPRFIHRTFAEYFVASFLTSEFGGKSTAPKTVLVMKAALDCERCVLLTVYSKISSFKFSHQVITYFVNALIADGYSIPGSSLQNFLGSADQSQEVLQEMAHSCATSGHVKIFRSFMEVIPEENKHLLNTLIFSKDLLWLVIEYSSLEFIQLVFQQFYESLDFDLDTKIKALGLAVRRGEFSIVEYLVNQKELQGILERLEEGAGLLLHLCVEGSRDEAGGIIDQKVQILRFLVGANPNLLEEKDSMGRTPLLSPGAHMDLLQGLIRLGANVLARNKRGESILYLREFGLNKYRLSGSEFQKLLEGIPDDMLGKLVHMKDSSGKPPLMKLMEDTDPLQETLERLKKAGADFNFDLDGSSILRTAIKNQRNKRTLQKLAECGANTAWKGKGNRTLLHYAAKYGNVQAVELLIDEQQLPVNSEDDEGLTPLAYAIQRNYPLGKRLQTYLALDERGGRLKPSVTPSKGQTWLHVAAEKGELEAVRFLLLKTGSSTPNAVDFEGNTPLHLLMAARNKLTRFGESSFTSPVSHWSVVETARLLLQNNGDLNIQNKKGESPLQLLLSNDDLSIGMIQLLKDKEDVGWTPTLATLAVKQLVWKGFDLEEDEFGKLFKKFVNLGADFKIRDPDGNSLLHLAASKGHQRAVPLLVQSGADVKLANNLKQTVLHHAGGFDRSGCNLGMINYLIDIGGADLCAAKDEDGNNFLHYYIRSNGYFNATPSTFHSLVERLVEKGIVHIFNDPDGDLGLTPLHWMMYMLEDMEEKTLKLLHSNGADFSAVNHSGDPILAYAIRGKKKLNTLSLLVNTFGALNSNHRNNNEESLLHTAAIDGRRPFALKFLLEQGEIIININGRNLEGNTPLHSALRPGGLGQDIPEMCRLLVGHGADMNLANDLGQVPLHRAALVRDKNLSLEAIQSLIDGGADVYARDGNNHIFLHDYATSLEPSSMAPAEFHSMAEYLGKKGHFRLFDVPGGESGFTPFQAVVLRLSPELRTMTLLQSNGVNFNAVDKDGKSILSYAISGGRGSKLMAQLVQHGADPKVLDGNGRSLLHISALEGSLECLKFLLDTGELDVNGLDMNGETPLHLAVQGKADVLEKCKLLIGSGADSNIANSEGHTPLLSMNGADESKQF